MATQQQLLPPGVDPAMVMYLNPELQASAGFRGVEDVRDRWQEIANLPSAIPDLPPSFDEQVYIADNRDTLDISLLNRVIYTAMTNDGVDNEAIHKNGTYLGTIMRSVVLVGRNAFEFDDIDELAAFRLDERALQVGDDVKLTRPNGTDHVYGRVTALNRSTYRFTISNCSYDVIPGPGVETRYEMYGIKLFDYERLARINLARRYLSDPTAQELLVPNRNFNKEFHQLLYPNTRLMTQSEAYVDFVNRWGLKDYRLANASDLYNANAPLTTILNLQVRCNLQLGKVIKWNGFNVTNFSSNYWSTSDEASDSRLITERAIKIYVDQQFRTTAYMNNLHVLGETVADGPVALCSNVYVTSNLSEHVRDTRMRCNLHVDCNVGVSGYISCATTTQTMQLLAISRIGIGSDGAEVTYDDFGGLVVMPPLPGTGTSGNGGGGTETGGTTGGTGIGTGTGTGSGGISTVNDKILFANGAYTIEGNRIERCLRIYPSAATSPESQTVYDQYGNLAVGVPKDVTEVDYKLYVDGDVFATGVMITQSDERRKKDIQQLDPDDALARLLRLRGCTYVPAPSQTMVSSSSSTSDATKEEGPEREPPRRHVGLIAQDVMDTFPEAVYTDSAGFHSVAYGNLMGAVVESLRNLDARMRSIEKQMR
jgi:uncharacterized protein YxjI